MLTTIANVHWFYWAGSVLLVSLFSSMAPIESFKNLGAVGTILALALFVAIALSTIGNVRPDRNLAMIGQYIFLGVLVLFFLVFVFNDATLIGLPLLPFLALHGFLAWWTSMQDDDAYA